MRLVAAPLAALLLGWLPGHATARWYRARSGRPFLADELWPFPEVLFGLCFISWLAFALAEWGYFSLPALALLVAVYSGLFLLLAGRRADSPPRRTPSFLAAGGIAVLVALAYLPPYDTVSLASDATFYLSTGAHIARHGWMAVGDPLVSQLGFFERAWLLLRDAAGTWTRMVGGVLVPWGGTEVMWVTFSHMLPVWIAIFHGLGGLQAAGLVGPTFAALSLWAVFLLTAELRGLAAATVAAALLATNVGEFFYGRFLMPEIVTQFFLWGGFVAFVVWWRRDELSAGVLAALALGVAGLTRIEYLLVFPLAVVLQLALAPRRPAGLPLFLLVYGALLAHGFAHVGLAPSHYRDIIRGELTALWASATPTLAAIAVLVLLAVGFAVARGRWVLLRRLVALGATAAFAAAFVARSQPIAGSSASWIAAALPLPVLAVAGVGLVVWLDEARGDAGGIWLPLLACAVVGGALLYDPHVRPFQLWAARRFVPIVIPFLCVSAAVGVVWAARTVWWRTPTLASLALGASLLVPNLIPTVRLARLPIYPDQRATLESLVTHMTEGGVVLIASDLERYGFHLSLWLIHDHETFVLKPILVRQTLDAIAPVILQLRPALYYLGSATSSPPRIQGLTLTPVEEASFRFVLPAAGGGTNQAPDAVSEIIQPVRLYQITPPLP